MAGSAHQGKPWSQDSRVALGWSWEKIIIVCIHLSRGCSSASPQCRCCAHQKEVALPKAQHTEKWVGPRAGLTWLFETVWTHWKGKETLVEPRTGVCTHAHKQYTQHPTSTYAFIHTHTYVYTRTCMQITMHTCYNNVVFLTFKNSLASQLWKRYWNWAKWCMPVFLTPRRVMQED